MPARCLPWLRRGVKDTALEQAGPSVKSASLVLAEQGHQPAGYRDHIYARMPDANETAFFRLSSPVPSPSSAEPPTTQHGPSGSPNTSTAPTESGSGTE